MEKKQKLHVPRKRIKLECLECGSVFDDDYKRRHESAKHNNKCVLVKKLGAPANPFEAAAASARKRQSTTEIEDEHTITSDISSPSKSNESTLLHVDNTTSTSQSTNLLPPDEVVANAQTMPISPTGTLSQDNSQSEEIKFSWVTCAGKVQEFLSNFEKTQNIMNNLKNEVIPNPKLFIVEITDSLSKILKECGDLLEYTKIGEQEIFDEKNELLNTTDEVLAHDPAKRKKVLSIEDRRYLISVGPHQPKLSTFPSNKEISADKHFRRRQFNPAWYRDYPMLEYSLKKDEVYCFACTLFPEGPGRSNQSQEWISSGVRSWHKMTSRGTAKKGKLISHFTSETHKAALNDYCHFIVKDKHVDILLDKSRLQNQIREEQEREYHRKVIEILMDVTRYLVRQGLAFRGHIETEDGNGNFRQLVNLLARHCPIMKKWLSETTERSHHVTYLSSQSQNEFITLLGSKTRDLLVQEIKSAGMFSVISDTTPDLSHKDRIAVNLRYTVLKNNKLVSLERLMQMDVVLNKKTGEDLAKQIFQILNSMGLQLDQLVFQSYDFASNMSGKHQGVQQKLSELCGRVIPYIPCEAHRLNIFIETACNSSILIRSFFEVLQNVYVFFNGSTKRFHCLNEGLVSVENSLKLKNLSQTRWTARAESVKALSVSFESIIDVLDEISKSNVKEFDTKTKTQSTGLLKRMLDFDFIASLYFLKNVMWKLKSVTELLEAETLNIIDAIQILESTSNSFEQLKTGKHIDALVESASSFAEKLGIDSKVDFCKHHRRRVPPKKIDGNPQTVANIDFFQFYRKEFIELLDVFTYSINAHLKDFIKLLKPFYSIFRTPPHRDNCSAEMIASIIKMFPQLLPYEPEAMHAETEILLDACQDLENFHQIAERAHELQNALPKAFTLVKLIITSPVTSASSERSFSKLKFVHNHLRTTTQDERLDWLMVLFSSKDVLDSIDLSQLVNGWAAQKLRRAKF